MSEQSENAQKLQGFYGRPPINSSSAEDLPRQPVEAVSRVGGIIAATVFVVMVLAFCLYVTIITWGMFWLLVAVTVATSTITHLMRDRDDMNHARYSHDQHHAHVIAKDATTAPEALTEKFREQADENLRRKHEREEQERREHEAAECEHTEDAE